ncbi:dTDP-glucose 4,6-dehydratase [Sphaerisporangium dianthi]|uniref:dTDP-glucose 4,6-dehydratase n=1 Tax=Sphaerisporangium dianthi TaxID=1436120 RepID=A0ABV9CF49_9ACTN
MRLLVTGGAGFIGSAYVRALLAGAYPSCAGARVTVLDKLTYAGNPANLAPVASHPGYTFVRGDITDAALLAEVVPGHHAIVNFAAETHVDRSIAGAAGFVTTNVQGTQRLLDAALSAGVHTVVQVSTDEVYGSIAAGSWDESAPLLPNSPYSAAKAGGDLLCRAYHRTYGLDVRVTRCANNYGPYQYPEKVIPLFVTNLIDGLPVPLYGDGGNVREWLHVDDHCRAVQLVLDKGCGGEVYNIGGGVELTNLALTERLLAAFGAGWEQVVPVADRPGHDRRYSVDSSKIEALGFEPGVGFERGLAEVVRWYRDHQEWWRPLKTSGHEGHQHEGH